MRRNREKYYVVDLKRQREVLIYRGQFAQADAVNGERFEFELPLDGDE